MVHLLGNKIIHEKVILIEARKISNPLIKSDRISDRYFDQIKRFKDAYEDIVVAIEKPIFSWGRKNPKIFEATVANFYLLWWKLRQVQINPLIINPQTVKKVAKAHVYRKKGVKTKDAMVKSFQVQTHRLPFQSTKKGRETIADAYFIALAGRL